MVFGKFKNYPIFRYIIYDFLKKVSRGSRPTCLAKILCAMGEHAASTSHLGCGGDGYANIVAQVFRLIGKPNKALIHKL